MSEADEARRETRAGDVWSWHKDGSPSAIVRSVLDGEIWFDSPVDNLPIFRVDDMEEFFRWTRTATLVSRGRI